MKKVLLITTHFAPSRHVGAKRPVKFCKFLPQYGWEAIVLTKEAKYSHGIDESLNRDLPAGLKIHRVKEWHPPAVRGGSADHRRKGDGRKRSDKLQGLKRFLCSLFFYDYSWLFPAFWKGLRIIRQEGVDAILSTSPPAEPHLLGLLLRICTGKKWICDFRDPWTKLPASVYHPLVIQRALDRLLEGKTLSESNRIICASDTLRYDLAAGLEKGILEKSVTIYNGYDRDDFKNGPINRNQKFTITYVGTWGAHTTPEVFLEAIAGLVLRKKELSEQMKVNLVGEVKFDSALTQRLKIKMAELGLNGVLHWIPFRSYREALAVLSRSDILLLVVGNEAGRMQYRIPAKLFEYLYAGKPILALVPPGGEAARIVRQLNAGWVVPPTDVQATEEAIWSLYQSYQAGRLTSHADLKSIEQFDRRKEAGQLAKLLDSLSRG